MWEKKMKKIKLKLKLIAEFWQSLFANHTLISLCTVCTEMYSIRIVASNFKWAKYINIDFLNFIICFYLFIHFFLVILKLNSVFMHFSGQENHFRVKQWYRMCEHNTNFFICVFCNWKWSIRDWMNTVSSIS